MSTLQELIRYCGDENHLGALLLTGEWGCGKTYLIEKELAEALGPTHFFVRVSLLGVESVDALNDAVRKQWLSVCTPFLGKIKENQEQMKKGRKFFHAISAILSSLNPISGNVASAIVTVDPLEYIPLEAEVEDYHDKGTKKKVVLVFDDLNSTKLNWEKVIGAINGYCENKGFKTIIIANEEAVIASQDIDLTTYKMLKEKTIARTVLYIPDYPEIIRGVITRNTWPSGEYEAFLGENERLIHDVFSSDTAGPGDELGKNHNIRSLTGALLDFYRVYEILSENCIPYMERYLYSFITYVLVSRSGIYKNGRLCYDVTEEDIRRLYPGYSADTMPGSIRQWIENGIWEPDMVLRDVTARSGDGAARTAKVFELEDPSKAAALFAGWEDLDVSAAACLEGVMGKVCVTDPEEPRSTMAVIGDFVFFAGEPDPELLRGRPDKWLLAVPQDQAWAELIENQLPANKRIRYAIKKDTKFDREKLQAMADALPEGYSLRRFDAELYDMCVKDETFSECVSTFGSREKYLELGRGVAVMKGGRIVSAASSYARSRDAIDIEIDTVKAERRRGLASAAAAGLILQCLDEGLYPAWDAANLASVRLAEKLGYEFSREYPCYVIE